MNEPKPEQMISIEGTKGCSVFYRMYTWCISPDYGTELQSRIDEMLSHVQGLNDDRLLVLLGALIIENALDEMLAAIMPGYKPLQKKRDFTFSLRIEVAKALRLIPAKILNCVDLIRSIRNDFVHNLSIDVFDRLEPSTLQSMRDKASNLNVQTYEEHAGLFREFVVLTAVSLCVYTEQISRLNDFIRSSAFPPNLKAFLERS